MSNPAKAEIGRLLALLSDREWRMNNLYMVMVDGKQPGPFVARPEQLEFRRNRHTRNFVPKARKLGLSTEIIIENLDFVFFTPNGTAAIIDETADAAWAKLEIAKNALKWGPLHPNPSIAALWVLLLDANPITINNNGELAFSNGASFEAGASFTGRTPNRLHISELGPICDQRPERGEEILQGSINAALPDDTIDVETTMRAGQLGACSRLFSLAKSSAGKALLQTSWRLHFFSWLGHPDYKLLGRAPTNGDVVKYFADLWDSDGDWLRVVYGFKDGVPLERQAWYEEKQREQGEKMFQEFPSTITECDKAMVHGAIYPELAKLRFKGRVRDFDVDKGYPLCAYFDLGTEDGLAAWLIQKMPMDIMIHAWRSGDGLGADGAVEFVREWSRDIGPIAAVFIPHDADIRDKGSAKSFRTQMVEPGKLPSHTVHVVPRIPDPWTGIGEVRRRMQRMWFHTRCDVKQRFGETELPSGLGRLEGYRKKDNGLIQKDLCCHTADALRTFGEADALGMIEAACSGGSVRVPFNNGNGGTFTQYGLGGQVQQVRAIMGMRQ